MKLKVGKLYEATHGFWMGKDGSGVEITKDQVVMCVRESSRGTTGLLLLTSGQVCPFSYTGGITDRPWAFFRRIFSYNET